MNNDRRLKALLDAGLSTRAAGALYREGIETIEVCAGKTEPELRKIPNLGRKSINEIKEALHSRGLALTKQEEEWFPVRLARALGKVHARRAALDVAERELAALMAESGHAAQGMETGTAETAQQVPGEA